MENINIDNDNNSLLPKIKNWKFKNSKNAIQYHEVNNYLIKCEIIIDDLLI